MKNKVWSLLTQHDLYQQIFEKMELHLYFKNLEFEYIYCNELQAKNVGLNSAQDIFGKTDYDLFPKPIADQIRKNDNEVITKKIACTFDEESLNADEQNKIYLTHKIPLYSSAGNIIGLAGISFDITARKRMEEKAQLAKETAELTLASIIENLPGHVYWKNKDSVYQGCNLAQARSAGFSHISQMVGKTDCEMPWQHEAQILRESDLEVMHSRKTLTREEASQLANKNYVSIFLSKKAPLFDRKGEVVGILGVSFDITDRKKMEEDLRQAHAMAEAANQAKTEFLENMRHDIRTPLTGIVGFSEILKHESNEQRIKDYADNLIASSHALLALLDEVLEAVRVSSGEIPKLKKKFNLQHTLNHVIELNRARAAQKKLSFTLEIDPALPQFVIGDKVRLHRIALELVANALNFTNHGFVKLCVSLAKQESRQIILKLVVEDSGLGIPKDKQQDIYVQFKRLTPSYQGIYKGAGLGLFVIKQFIDELEGEIYVESEIKKGSRFSCLIPLQIPLIDDASGVQDEMEKIIDGPYETTYTQQINPQTQPAKNHPLHILVVEDNVIAQTVAKSILSKMKCDVDIADTGKNAISQWKNKQYDLIFMDIGLPDMDGYEVTRQIRLQELIKKTHIPIIALTAHVGDENKQKCIEAGMNAVLTKPLSPKSCLDILDALISG